MKTPKGAHPDRRSDELRKARRLEPIRKSGKERHALYGNLRDDDEEDMPTPARRESAFDYYDEEEE